MPRSNRGRRDSSSARRRAARAPASDSAPPDVGTRARRTGAWIAAERRADVLKSRLDQARFAWIQHVRSCRICRGRAGAACPDALYLAEDVNAARMALEAYAQRTPGLGGSLGRSLPRRRVRRGGRKAPRLRRPQRA